MVIHRDHFYQDSELEEVVRKMLDASSALDSSQITITAKNGSIILTGTVRSDEEKSAASSITHLVHGGVLITNELVVKH